MDERSAFFVLWQYMQEILLKWLEITISHLSSICTSRLGS